MTFNGTEYSGTVTEGTGASGMVVVYFNEDQTFYVLTWEGDTGIGLPYDMGSVGESVSVRIVQTD